MALLQRMKTGALFEFSCEAGAILAQAGAGRGGAKMRGYAHDFGFAFQISDDLLDALGDEAAVGKAVGKDAEQGKATLVSLWGVERARDEARRLAERAAAAAGRLRPGGGRLARSSVHAPGSHEPDPSPRRRRLRTRGCTALNGGAQRAFSRRRRKDARMKPALPLALLLTATVALPAALPAKAWAADPGRRAGGRRSTGRCSTP